MLRVSRRDYVQALDLFYRAAANGVADGKAPDGFADYWGDVAYLAERVLTIEELQNYVGHKPSAAGVEQAEKSRVRSVLARRLMRRKTPRGATVFR